MEGARKIRTHPISVSDELSCLARKWNSSHSSLFDFFCWRRRKGGEQTAVNRRRLSSGMDGKFVPFRLGRGGEKEKEIALAAPIST